MVIMNKVNENVKTKVNPNVNLKEKVAIKSNTAGKLTKIMEGTVFNDSFAFITEFLQNSYRAKAKREIILNNNSISFKDDGVGLKDPTPITTLDYSSWESCKGFGIGFWSFLAVPDVSSCEVISGKYDITIDITNLFIDGEPKAEVSRLIEKVHGFQVEIVSNYFEENMTKAIERIKKEGSLQPYEVILNGEVIEKKDILSEYTQDYIKEFDNKYFTGVLGASDDGYVNVYFEKRSVCRIWLDHIGGVIELKTIGDTCSVPLKEPDRKGFVYGAKYDKLEAALNKNKRELYLELISKYDNIFIEKFAYEISRVLESKDYEKFLMLDLNEYEELEEKRDISDVSCSKYKAKAFEKLNDLLKNFSAQSVQLGFFDTSSDPEELNSQVLPLLNKISNTENSESIWVCTGIASGIEEEPKVSISELENISSICIGKKIYERKNKEDLESTEIVLSDFEQEDEIIKSEITITSKKEIKKKKGLVETLKKSRKKVWVKSNEQSDYEKLIARCQYYGVKVYVAKNVLFECVFKSREVPHISELKDGITKTNISKNIGLKNKKEIRFIKNLMPIIKYYKLPSNLFTLGNLSLLVETKLKDKVIDREIQSNTKETFTVIGVTDGSRIILDRKALMLSRFNLADNDNGFGLNDFKTILASIEVISHELAHYLYNTTDNTIGHFDKQLLIQRELEQLYNTI